MDVQKEQDRERALDAVKVLTAIQERDVDGLNDILEKYGHPDEPDFLGLCFGFHFVTQTISDEAMKRDNVPYATRLDLVRTALDMMDKKPPASS